MTPTEYDAENIVRDNEARQRYEVTVDGRTAVLTYRRGPGLIELIHTDVPAALRGHGLANTLAQAALEAARAADVRVVATCPFVRTFVLKHPEYRDLEHIRPNRRP